MQQLSHIRPSDAHDDRPQPAARPDDDVLDLRYLVRLLLRGWWIILIVTAIAAFMGLRSMLAFQPQYEATMIVDPSTGDSSSGSGGSSQVSSVARSFGISLARKAQATVFDRLRLLVSSVAFAELMQTKYGLLQKVYSGSWDPATQSWVRPTGWRFDWEYRIREKLKMARWMAPSVESLSEYLQSAFNVSSVGEGESFKKITVRHQDPDFALLLLQTMYSEADDLIRQQDRQQAIRQKQYLERQLQRVSLAEARVMLVGLLSAEEQRAMLLNGDFPYAAKIVVAPSVSTRPTSARALDLVVTTIGGLLVGTVAVLLIGLFRRE